MCFITPYIYKIENLINKKVYIGKTLDSINKRWSQHVKSIYKKHYEKRPLYSAMKKYGIENFTIQEIESVSVDNINERERYWIEYYQSFKNGYNATIGGDGRPYIDYDLVVETYNKCLNQKEVSRQLNIDGNTVRKILKLKGIEILNNPTVNILQHGKSVYQFSLDGEYIASYPSARQAAKSVTTKTGNGGAASHIISVCNGKRYSAYGYIWSFNYNINI